MKWNTPDRQDRPAETVQPGKWWGAAIVSLAGFTGLGALIGLTMFDGSETVMATVILTASGLIIGALLCVVFATISFKKKEKHRVWAVIPALPCAVLLAWSLAIFVQNLCHWWQTSRDSKVYLACIAQLQADPEIGLREHWAAASPTTPQRRAYYDSVWAQYVDYSSSQVERIYAESPPFRHVVFHQAACTPEFITAHFQEAFDLARKNEAIMLESIIRNPHTPLHLIQRVIFSHKQLPFNPTYHAGLTLRIRKSNVPEDPRGVLEPYERDAEGKFFVLTMEGLTARLPDGGGGKNRIPEQVNSYVPGLPPDFDVGHLGADEVVFLPGLYNEYNPVSVQQLNLAEAFALKHNQRVFLKRSSP